ncbi:Coenzyme A disulfide reductase [compost metagenome]
MKTNLENVYAVGDATQITDFVSGTQTAVPLAGPANKQGRIAADNICGLGTTYKGAQGTSVIKVFDLTGASTGNNEKTLERLGTPYHAIYVHPSSHATYYPGASPMTIKLLFSPAGEVLGAQAVGKGGVDKRLDVLASAIRFKGSITDLTELELTYAPPYSSAKDPVNMAGYAAENVLTGKTHVFLPRELEERDTDSTQLVDVRTAAEHARGHIPGSINIPIDELRHRLDELDASKEIWVYCQVGLRGYTASRILNQNDFRTRNLTGGFVTYQMHNYKPGQ